MVIKEPKRKDRARSSEDKQLRRASILKVTLELWRETDYGSVTMSSVAQRADLAKGTLYLYFPTKEELFLALLDSLLERWFEQVSAKLERVDSAQLAEILVRSLEGFEDMVRLLSILSSVLENNSSQAAVLEFKTHLASQSLGTGQILERILTLDVPPNRRCFAGPPILEPVGEFSSRAGNRYESTNSGIPVKSVALPAGH